MNITAFWLAQRYVGLAEVPGSKSNATVLGMLRLDQEWPEDDGTPWCSAFVNWITWHLRLPRSKSLRARSWLHVGRSIHLAEARPGWDVVVLQRGEGPQPGPEVIDAPGHVGFFAGIENDRVLLLGGNQGNAVTVEAFQASRILGVRRLRDEP